MHCTELLSILNLPICPSVFLQPLPILAAIGPISANAYLPRLNCGCEEFVILVHPFRTYLHLFVRAKLKIHLQYRAHRFLALCLSQVAQVHRRLLT